ncbi:serine/arginine repetitive matrix protein 1-like [Branchiostoma lanceolatum]|uniref:serine/arginine repetitive matrix protein 1-like n=1 Tax=Branchiostoma lanceolatum TaxID=7740 RepID=UPI0034519D31
MCVGCAPGPISDLTAEVLSWGSVRLSWQPPATPNGVITGYVVSYIPIDQHFPTTQKPTTVQTKESSQNGTEGEEPTDTSASRVTRDTGPTFDLDLENATLITMETSERSALLEGLYPSTVYHVQVVARTGAGAGATPVNITTTTLPWYPIIHPPTTPEPPTTRTISTPDKAVTETASPPPGGSNAALLQPHDVPIVVGVCLTGGILLLAIIGWAGWKCRHSRAKARRRGSYLVADEIDGSRVSEDSIFSALKESSNRRMDRYGVAQPYMLDTVQEEPRSSSRHSTSSRRKRAPSDSSSRHSTSSRRSSRKERRLREVEHVQAQLGDMEPGSALLQLQEEPADADYPGMDNLGFSNPGYSGDPDGIPPPPGVPPPATPSQNSPASLHSNRTPPGPHPPPPFAHSQNSAFSPTTLPSTKVGPASPTRSLPRRRPSPSDSSASRSKGRDSVSQNGSLPGSGRQSVTSDSYPSTLDPSHLPSTSITQNGSPPRRSQQSSTPQGRRSPRDLRHRGHQKTPSSAAGSSSGRSLPDTPQSSPYSTPVSSLGRSVVYSTPLSSVGRSGGKRSRKSKHSTPSGSGLSASDLEGVPPDVQELYSKVDLSKKRKNRMKRDSAAAIARALSQEGENDVSGILDDTPVVVYRERTAL